MAIEIVDFPINSMVIFHCYVSSQEGMLIMYVCQCCLIAHGAILLDIQPGHPTYTFDIHAVYAVWKPMPVKRQTKLSRSHRMYSRSARPSAQAFWDMPASLKGTWLVSGALGTAQLYNKFVLFFLKLVAFRRFAGRPFCCVQKGTFCLSSHQRPQIAPTFADPASCNPSNSVDTLWLVVWNMFFFFIFCPINIGNFIIPTDFHSIIFQRGRWLNHQPALTRCHPRKSGATSGESHPKQTAPNLRSTWI